MDHIEGETADQYFKRILDAVEDAVRKLVETYGIEAAPIAWPSPKGVPNEGVIACSQIRCT